MKKERPGLAGSSGRGTAFVAHSELNSLRQRQLAGEIDRVGLASHALPAIAAALAATAGLLFAAERAANYGTTVSVRSFPSQPS